MKKSVLIIIVLVILIGAGVGIYFLTQKKETNTNTNVNTNASANTNIQKARPVTYQAYSGTDKRIVFDTVSEWTSIAPEEVEKSVSAEMKGIYKIIYYEVSSESVVLAVSQRAFEKDKYTLSQMVDEEVKTAQKVNPGFRIEKIGETTDYITFKSYFANLGSPWVSTSKATVVTADPANDYYYLLEVTMPESLLARYSDITDDLLNSFQKAP